MMARMTLDPVKIGSRSMEKHLSLNDSDVRAKVLEFIRHDNIFKPAKGELLRGAALFMLSGLALFALANLQIPAVIQWIISIFLGVTYACMAFLAHDVSHGSVVKSRRAKYVIELLLWMPVLLPPTLWRIFHNKTHHRWFNTQRDTDRAYLSSDSNLFWKRAYMTIFSPMRGSLGVFNPLFLAHFSTYVARNLLYVLLGVKLPFMAAAPDVTWRERMSVVCELALIMLVHYFILFKIFDGLDSIFIIELLPVTIASSILMAFIFTNHLTQPILQTPVTLVSTISCEVPRWINFIFLNFGYHVEHHLFPAMPSRNYPKVADVLKTEFVNHYQSQRFIEIWSALLRSPFIRPANEPLDIGNRS